MDDRKIYEDCSEDTNNCRVRFTECPNCGTAHDPVGEETCRACGFDVGTFFRQNAGLDA